MPLSPLLIKEVVRVDGGILIFSTSEVGECTSSCYLRHGRITHGGLR